MTQHEWWKLVVENWKDILSFCEEYLPMDSHQDYEGNDTKKTVREQVVQAFEKKDGNILGRFLNEAWWQSPEGGVQPIWKILDTLYNDEPDWPEGPEAQSPLGGAIARFKRIRE